MTIKSIALPKIIYFRVPSLFQSVIARLESIIDNLYYSIIGSLRSKRSSERTDYSGISSEKRSPKKVNYKKLFKIAAIFFAVAIILFGAISFVRSRRGSGEKIGVQGARASQDINREFTFPLKDESGEEVSNVKYMLQRAEITDEIIVKGQKAKAVNGRAFLIITLKITNEYNKPIQMETRDYVRLSVKGNEEEWLAADIHNDPVEIQAISTKYTRLGFAVDDNAADLLLRIGEIDGEKELVPLEL